MAFKAGFCLCASVLSCVIFGAEAVGNRAFLSKADVGSDSKKTAFGRLGLPCALAGEKCYDKMAVCTDVGAGFMDVCKCMEGYLLADGKCRKVPASDENMTEASFGGCPYAASLMAQHNQKKAAEKLAAAAGAGAAKSVSGVDSLI
ncbi:hypothetical protein BV898_03048 [Hypsibius exemplaris]|uniref:EB domain-containing protein n=1 Tax=Hypsibius exemplaris TaxID=2072580 RepID=A0A1W0X5X2_HYPEX|nr:hypothetical protein BV898_03048 [Hypsibius exemplaris]